MKVSAIQAAQYGALAAMVRTVDFFSPLTVGQLEEILPHMRLLHCDKGETVFKQGDAGDAFYIIYTGAVDVRVKDGFFSLARTVATLETGSFFGAIALVSNEPRTATIVTTEATQLFCLVASDFKFILDGNPRLREQLIRLAPRQKFFQKIK